MAEQQSLGAAVGAVRSAVDALLDAATGPAGDAELLAAADILEATRRRLDAARVAVLADITERGLFRGCGAATPAAWIATRGGLRPREAHTLAALAHDRELAPTNQALQAGAMSLDHAGVITTTLRSLPGDVPADARADAQTALIKQAQELPPNELARTGRHLIAALDPTRPGVLNGSHAAAEAAAELNLASDDHGVGWLTGRLGPEGTAILTAALDPLSAPRPTGPDGPDARTPAQRRAHALIELARRALANDLIPASNGGTATRLTLTIDYQALKDALGATARTDTGADLSPAAARRLACDTQLIPAILGTPSQPLDLGRATYTVPPALRRAVILRDQGCTFPGCDRPPAWCQAHHIHHWANGGPTNLNNLTLLCGHHHRLIHHHGWTIEMTNGKPTYRRTSWPPGAGPQGGRDLGSAPPAPMRGARQERAPGRAAPGRVRYR